MILVTGAAGKTGRAVIQALAARRQAVCALVHRPEQSPVVASLGAEQVVVGDMRSQPDMERAMQGIRAVYHICPNMSPDEVAIARVALRAARAAGLQHFVYHSVLHPQTESMPHHWQKLRAEELIFESGLPFTIVQPAAYMQNLLAYWDRMVEEGVYAVPYAVETRLGMVDLEDVAAAVAVVLTEAGHDGAIYELAGAEVLSQAEVAELIGRTLGRPVRAQAVSRQAWEEGARAAGLGDYQVQTLLQMFSYYEQFGFWGNPRVLGGLLGRPPTTLEAFVERAVRARRNVPPA